MINNDGLDLLAEEIKRRRDGAHARRSRFASTPAADADDEGCTEQQPLVLFIGPACAIAAGLPDKEYIARVILDLINRDEDLAAVSPLLSGGVSIAASLAGDELLRLFYSLMGELKKTASGKLYRMFLKFYANVPVPLFYQDLALLIKAEFFERILTTNIDTLLEQALGIAGLQAGHNYQVISLGVADDDDDDDDDDDPDGRSYGGEAGDDDLAQQRKIVKLFGDLAREQVNIHPSEIERALKSRRSYVKSELEGDIVMVGYDFESKPINEWLKYGGARRGQLWWVGEHMPSPQTTSPEQWARQVRFITGKIGRPQEFFGQLKLRLLPRPVFDLPDYPGKESLRQKARAGGERALAGFESSTVESAGGGDAAGAGMTEAAEEVAADANNSESPTAASGAPPDAAPPEEAGLVEDLRGNIRRSQAVLFSLEQTAPPGDIPVSVRTQVAYQKQQIAKMEDRIRSLKSSRRVIADSMDVILREVRKAREAGSRAGDAQFLNDATVNFLERQRRTVGEENERDEPNQFVVSAAVGATLVLAERLCVELGADVFDPEPVRRLAAFAPSVAGRGIV